MTIAQQFEAKGRKEHAQQVAMRLLEKGDFSAEEVAEVSGLPLSEVKELQPSYTH